MGKNFTRMGGVIIDPSHCWHIAIGDNVVLAPRVHILAHDASTKIFLGYTRVANTRIGNNVFIGAGSIVLPGVSIEDNVIVGAESVVRQNVPDNSVAVGNPAKIICSLDDYLNRQSKKRKQGNVFDGSYTLRNPKFSEQQRKILFQACEKYGESFLE